MNVLILTPDAVGSTLLQRMLTIYMQFHQFGRPVINLHELTNGLAKYYSPEFNCELVGKQAVKNWGYYQTLEQIVELLGSVNHYKTSRLAHYHIRSRGDTIAQQIPFYNYLNENFYIVACRRANVFEHALSMTLNKITKKLNVYSAYEKVDTFYEMYQSGVTLDPDVFVNQLNAYRDYISWSEQYFNIGSYFNYEQDVPRLEKYILDLPVFRNQAEVITWDKNFGISFNDWNKMHYARSDINSIAAGTLQLLLENSSDDPTVDYQQHAPEHWPGVSSKSDFDNLPIDIKIQFAQQRFSRDGVGSLLSADRQQFLSQHKNAYTQAQHTINQMIKLGIIISGPPIKKQTLAEKAKIIKNFDQLTEIYNHWTTNNTSVATPIVAENFFTQIQTETQFWTNSAADTLKLGQ
jgi:hypothetical protein